MLKQVAQRWIERLTFPPTMRGAIEAVSGAKRCSAISKEFHCVATRYESLLEPIIQPSPRRYNRFQAVENLTLAIDREAPWPVGVEV